MIPEVDGLDVCRELRKSSGVPIIMITARGEEIDRVVGLEIGADDYVTKPFSVRELMKRVKAVLRRAQNGGSQKRTIDNAAGPKPHHGCRRRMVTVADLAIELTRLNLICSIDY